MLKNVKKIIPLTALVVCSAELTVEFCVLVAVDGNCMLWDWASNPVGDSILVGDLKLWSIVPVGDSILFGDLKPCSIVSGIGLVPGSCGYVIMEGADFIPDPFSLPGGGDTM